VKFFNLDLHISVIGDIKYIFENLGHKVDNWSISGHSWVFGKNPDNVEYVNQNTWKNINEEMIDSFYNRYKEELSGYDAFIVTHTPCFSMLYERFGKPIITISSTRYEAPFSNQKDKWNKFNSYLRKGIDNKSIIPISNNKYDSKYAELYTDREWKVIPSLCEYTNSSYVGDKEDFILFSKCNIQHKIPNLLSKEKALGQGYSWEDLARFSGVVHVPYNSSTMSIFEQYTSNIPLFFPTFDLLSEMREKYSRYGVLSELSWNQVFGYSPCSALEITPDPNRYTNNEEMMQWVRYADFYDEQNMPFLQYYESFEHLQHILRHVDTESISLKMKEHNRLRQREVYAKWQKVLEDIEC